LLLAFVGLELASLSLYVLVGYDKTRPESAEAGLKYFLVGGTSAAFLLFGISLIYGVTGSLMFQEISGSLLVSGQDPLVAVAMIMVLVAFGYKAAAAPFHLWAPDAYQGAPTTSAAFVASASKLAGFVLFTRLLWQGLPEVAGDISNFEGGIGWLPVVAVLGGASILLGNIVALAQSNVRRLLAYSAIAHAGALLIGVMVFAQAGPGPLYYYAMTYGVATIGAFGVISVLERSGPVEKLSDLAGLNRRSPFLTACLFVFVLSLAGIPPLAGFFGKFYVFAAAFQAGGFSGPIGWLAALAIVFSAVGFYYYLIILKQAFVVEKPDERFAPVEISFVARVGLLIAALIVVGLGIWPSVLLEQF
jgi:NADH-quinone oxidoreductase subunit N